MRITGCQRRRGEALEEAIREAVFAELSEVGYGSFSIESVAARAQTGKASIYRRWPAKHDLVLDALDHRAREAGAPLLDLDDDITTEAAFRRIAESIAETIDSPVGDAIRTLKCEAVVDPELARIVDERFQRPRSESLLGVLRRGVARGEVRPEAATPIIADIVPAMIAHRLILQRRPFQDGELTQIVDHVLLPLISTARSRA